MDEIDPFRTIISKAKEVRKELKSKFDAIKLKHGLQDKEISQLLMLANTDKSPFSKEEHQQLLNYRDKATGPLYIFSETLTKDCYDPDDQIKFNAFELGNVTVKYCHFKRWYPDAEPEDDDECYWRSLYTVQIQID